MQSKNLVYMACLAAMRLLAGDSAVIVNSGSTNTAGFRIVVERSGKASRSETRRSTQAQPKSIKVPKKLVDRFYADLEAARPLSKLPRQACMKSASFGTVLTVELAGDETPDLSCGDHGDSRIRALIQDTSEIEKLFTD